MTSTRATVSTTSSSPLRDPFPAPEIYLSTATKSDKYGVTVRREGAFLYVTQISESSPLRGTSLRAGQLLLCVNDNPVTSPAQAVAYMKATTALLRLTTADAVVQPYCKLVAAPISVYTPGVSFESVRSRSLVRVSMIYSRGTWSGRNLSEGDIVLSINGNAVSTPRDADHHYTEANQQPFVIIYAIDMKKLKEGLAEDVIRLRTMEKYRGSVKPDENPDGIRIAVDPKGPRNSFYMAIDGIPKTTRLFFDKETMHITKPDEYMLMVNDWNNPKLFFKGKYGTIARPLMNLYNEQVEARLRPLQEAVDCAVWRQRHPSSDVTVQTSARYEGDFDLPVAHATVVPL